MSPPQCAPLVVDEVPQPATVGDLVLPLSQSDCLTANAVLARPPPCWLEPAAIAPPNPLQLRWWRIATPTPRLYRPAVRRDRRVWAALRYRMPGWGTGPKSPSLDTVNTAVNSGSDNTSAVCRQLSITCTTGVRLSEGHAVELRRVLNEAVDWSLFPWRLRRC